MPELTPLDDNRQEHFLNGEDLEPITRREHFYASRESELPEGHQEPETREEWFIQQYRGGGGDVTVVPLSITENGTYSEEGKAYSPVDVNVPLPQNAYLLKSVTTPTPIASFNDGEDMVMPSLKVAIEPQQDLHGYDAPWFGGAGKNKFDQDIAYASYKQSDGGFRVTGNAVTLMKNYIPQSLVGQQVTVSVYFDLTKEASPNGIRIACNIGGTETESSRVEANEKKTVSLTFTPNATTDYWYITYGNTGANYFTFKDCQLEIGSTATTFAPYSNICPISGWSECNVTRCGKNHFDNTTITVKKFLTSDGRIETSANWSISDYIGVKGGTAYILSGVTNAGTVAYHCFYDKDKNFISSVISTTQNFTTPSNAVYVRLSMRTETPDAVQLELGNTATEYHAYNGQTYTIDLDGTRYGVDLDVINGIGREYKEYPSYNGETLIGPWISDRDVYAEGTTPTIGAQVLDMGDITTFNTIPTAVKSLRGVNNLFADSGQVQELSYFSKS